MRTETITHNIYTFDELPENIQEKVLEKHRYFSVEGYEWYDYVYDYWIEELEHMGYENPDISFSGFYSQGDGASFTCTIDIVKWIEENTSYNDDYTLLKKWWDYIEFTVEIKRSSYSGHYVHEKTVDIAYNYYDYDLYIDWDVSLFPFSKRVYTKLVESMEYIQDEMLDHARDLMQDLYYNLMKEYKYLTSNENIAESLACNEYELDEYGNIW